MMLPCLLSSNYTVSVCFLIPWLFKKYQQIVLGNFSASDDMKAHIPKGTTNKYSNKICNRFFSINKKKNCNIKLSAIWAGRSFVSHNLFVNNFGDICWFLFLFSQRCREKLCYYYVYALAYISRSSYIASHRIVVCSFYQKKEEKKKKNIFICFSCFNI